MSSSSLQICAFLLSFFVWFVEWKEKQLGNILINLFPGENSVLKEIKKEKTPFSLLFMSIIELLVINYCFGVNFSSNRWWKLLVFECFDSNNNLIMWFSGSDWVLSCSLPLSFYKYRWIGIRPVIASIPNEGEVWKAPNIYMVALCCIFLSVVITFSCLQHNFNVFIGFRV